MSVKIGLGTAQFGSGYGVTNSHGVCPPIEINRIIRRAAEAGVQIIDTAAAYGRAIDVLGKLLAEDHEFRIVTKITSASGDDDGAADFDIARQLEATLERIGQASVYGMMFHHASDLFWRRGQDLWRQALALKEQGLVAKLGVSFRAPEEVDRLLGRFPIDLAQVPFNILDQRMLRGGQLRRLEENRVEIHSRSVFLQGLLMADPDGLPSSLNRARPALETLQNRFGGAKHLIMKAALDFALSRQEIDCIVVGVTSYGEFNEILELLDQPRETVPDCASLASNDIEIIDPTRWPQSLIYRPPKQSAEAVGGA